MKPAAVSHVLMKMEHRFTSLMELLSKRRKTINLSEAKRLGEEKKTDSGDLKMEKQSDMMGFINIQYAYYCGLVESC